MGVYIKGVTKSQLMKVIINSTEFMPDDFEVIEVKTPHGRLIDADKQFRGLQKQVMALYIERSEKYSYLMDVLDSINREPTVIETEGESR